MTNDAPHPDAAPVQRPNPLLIIPCESLTIGTMPTPDGTHMVSVMLTNAAAMATINLTADLAEKVSRDLTSAIARARGLVSVSPPSGLHLPGQ